MDSRPAVSTVFGRVYNAVGQSTSGIFIANQTTTHDHYMMNGAAALVANDTVVLAWEAIPDSGPGANLLNVFFRRIGIEVPDPITGTSGPDTLNGTANSDLIYGLADNDVLNGGLGADRMEGGAGNDIYFVDQQGDQVIELARGGSDRIYASASYTLAAGLSVELFTTANNTGTSAINLTGNELADMIYGNDGTNTLDGKAGADVLIGRLGDDNYFVDNAGDIILEYAGEGSDRIYASVSYTLAAGLSVELFTTENNTGTSAINLTGNELANLIYGNDGNNTLNGAAGADYMAGRLGDDNFFVDNAGDGVEEFAGQGNDRIYASVSYTLGAGVSVELFTTANNTGTGAINLTGNELGNLIYGNDGANMLDGKAGADVLVGRLGNDNYFVDNAGDIILEYAGEGSDRIYASVSYGLTAGLSVELFTTENNLGTSAISLTGNELANLIYGNDGNNTLNGAAGADYMAGRLGNDNFFVDNAGDGVEEFAGQGSDRVYASVSYTLGAGVSVELFTTENNTGTSAINLTGNELFNEIYGNDGANTLDGKAGSDVLIGRAGADTFAFTTALGVGNVDIILDFQTGVDKVALDDAIFTGLGLGALPAAAFVIGTGAADASDRIIYNSTTGALLFDVDGIGGVAAVQFATLQGNPALAASDFTVI